MTKPDRSTPEQIAADDNARTTDLGLYNFGESYRLAADRLFDDRETLRFPDPVAFLYFHAIELFFKSFLRFHRVSVAQLRSKKYGHDLTKLHEACNALGLELPPEIDTLFLFFDANEPLMARYIRTGARRGIDYGRLKALAQIVQVAVRDHMRRGGSIIR